MQLERVEVECFSGYRVNERPLAFTFQGQRHVVEVLDRWYEGGVDPTQPALRYFRVRVPDGRVFMLRYNAWFDAWAICLPDDARRLVPTRSLRRGRGGK